MDGWMDGWMYVCISTFRVDQINSTTTMTNKNRLNSVTNKFSSLQQNFLSKIDILLLSETKIDDSFPDSQFFAKGFKMYRKDRTKPGGGILLYVNENLPDKITIFYKFKENSETILFEFSVSNKRWLLLSNFKPPSRNGLSFINELNFAQYMKILFCLAISICPQKTLI